MTIRTWGVALICVAGGWLATVLTVMVVSDAAPGAIVLLPSRDFVNNLPEGAAVVGGGGLWLAVRGDTEGLGLALYRAGGRMVLPAGLPGCLPLPKV
ncbi:hypothetical protein [Roseovarius phycicola]|uniref:Uncharacterized protein n=1 Tax=Roseovarius phycicola TaxID=3080976 RepID=A0ABZ2HGN6_9RHOB